MRKPRLILALFFVIAAAVAIFLARDQAKPSPSPAHPPSLAQGISQTTPHSATAPSPGTDVSGSPLQSPGSEGNDTIVLLQDIKNAINAQDFTAALAIADRLMADAPNDTTALVRARVLISLGRKAEAFEALDDILATSRDADILHQTASRYFIVARDEGLIAEALAAQQARLNNAPDDPVSLSVMAQLYEAAQDDTNELLVREQLQSLDGSPSNLARMAELQRSLGRIDDASASVARLAASTDADTAAHLLLQQAHAENTMGRYDLAVATSKRALALPDISPFMTVQFARELEAAGDTAAAVFSLEQLAEATETPEVRDRASLVICRIQMERGEPVHEVSAKLTKLKQSRVPYVQEQAAQLLNHTH